MRNNNPLCITTIKFSNTSVTHIIIIIIIQSPKKSSTKEKCSNERKKEGKKRSFSPPVLHEQQNESTIMHYWWLATQPSFLHIHPILKATKNRDNFRWKYFFSLYCYR